MIKIYEITEPIQASLQYAYKLTKDSDNYGNPVLWLKLDDKRDLLNAVRVVANLGGRCITITAYKSEKGHILVYHLDIDGILLNIETEITNHMIESITPLLPSADWAEREFREMYGIEPIGHPNSERLFLDESLMRGVLNRYIPLSKMMLGVSESDILWERVEKEKRA
jgi:NADH:ubiquinone oxidoreductase subunit C